MTRKLISLVLAMMLILGSVAGLAEIITVVPEVTSETKIDPATPAVTEPAVENMPTITNEWYNIGYVAAIQAMINANPNDYKVLRGFVNNSVTITSNGISMIANYGLPVLPVDPAKDGKVPVYGATQDNYVDAPKSYWANYAASFVNTQEVYNMDAASVAALDVDAAIAQYTAAGYSVEILTKLSDNKVILHAIKGEWSAKNPGIYVIVTVTGDTNGYTKGDNDFGTVIKTAQDKFTHYYTMYNHTVDADDIEIVSSFAFTPAAFGDGVTFCHKNAQKLFTIKTKYAATLKITLKDQDGRMFPISNATYSGAANAYVTTVKANTEFVGYWYGADSTGYYKAGSATSPAKTQFDLKIAVVITTANTLDASKQTSTLTDECEIRFDYIVSHGTANEVCGKTSSGPKSSGSSIKTGDTRVAYIALASLVVLAGAAVVITKKIRTNI